MTPVIPKRELLVLIRRFVQDENRGISQDLFCELAGISKKMLFEVFVHGNWPMSETMQRRVSRAYQAWRAGEVAVMQNRDRTRFVQYRKTPKPRMARTRKIVFDGNGPRLVLGIRNRADYSDPDIDEQLGGK